ncbi:manganese-binding transcriptional regulator MntR [Botrimarina hoheduenensis]|uniref:Transcriptional regulator MntR n=1 Tax=Botrimarina hoheduenensis TaxID=2528000 RepID=A0A5C5VRX6_9BACT|nr:manganese-binding transcriptional regulator MntR [Botrimarina hoheduenensis]TWT40833.1 Transcriptional regulator MntR [Botrimarina hoheduenensis]
MSVPTSRQSKPFRRTRSDHASETAEDYVEAIAETLAAQGVCRNADLARLFGVSHVTVNKTVARLQREGLVDTEPYGPLELTASGERLAQASRNRHDIVLRFLLSLGVSRAVAEIDSEGIEHHVSKETLAAFESRLENAPPASAEGGPAK